MRIRPNVALSLAAALAWGALLSLPARAAGTKSNANDTIWDDLTEGSAGTVHATGGIRTLDGALSQVATMSGQILSPGTTVEAGFFSQIASAPVTAQISPVTSSSTISVSWLDVVPPNPQGTLYTVQASSLASFNAVIYSTAVYGFAGVLSGLHSYTSYYLRIAASYTDDDQESTFTALGSTLTLPNVPSGCAMGFTVKQDGSLDFTSIQAAVNSLPNPLTGNSCVMIEDGLTYAEQVTVQNYTMNGSSIAIFADPATGLRPKVSPFLATSTAAFVIANASVSVTGFDIVPAHSLTSRSAA